MTTLGIGMGVLALVIVGLALRLSGLRADRDKADVARKLIEKDLTAALKERDDDRLRNSKQLADLRQDIKELEYDLDQCVGPGDRRRRLERLLSKAADRE